MKYRVMLQHYDDPVCAIAGTDDRAEAIAAAQTVYRLVVADKIGIGRTIGGGKDRIDNLREKALIVAVYERDATVPANDPDAYVNLVFWIGATDEAPS